MTATILNDLHERVVSAGLRGESVSSLAKWLEIVASSVVKRSQRHRATGSIHPDEMGDLRKRILELHHNIIVQWLAETRT